MNVSFSSIIGWGEGNTKGTSTGRVTPVTSLFNKITTMIDGKPQKHWLSCFPVSTSKQVYITGQRSDSSIFLTLPSMLFNYVHVRIGYSIWQQESEGLASFEHYYQNLAMTNCLQNHNMICIKSEEHKTKTEKELRAIVKAQAMQPRQKAQDQDAPHETSPHICSTESSLLVLLHQDQDRGDCMCNMNLWNYDYMNSQHSLCLCLGKSCRRTPQILNFHSRT